MPRNQNPLSRYAGLICPENFRDKQKQRSPYMAISGRRPDLVLANPSPLAAFAKKKKACVMAHAAFYVPSLPPFAPPCVSIIEDSSLSLLLSITHLLVEKTLLFAIAVVFLIHSPSKCIAFISHSVILTRYRSRYMNMR